jgi:homoserine dehydrogenase
MILLTHRVVEQHQRCHHRPGSLAGVVGPVVRIRVEHLN